MDTQSFIILYKELLANEELMQKELAEMLGTSSQSLKQKIRRGTMPFIVLVKHFCNSTTYIFKNDIELHKESDNYCMNVACHGCTSHRQILQ